MKFTWVACGWYLTFFSSEVCIAPFLNVYMRSRGLSGQQIGIIGALRPWIGVPASFLGAIAADYFPEHRHLLLVSQLLSFNAIRLLLPAVSGFGGFLLVVVACTCVGSSITVMADAAVSMRCSEEGEYGRYRLWGAVGWGGMSTVAGVVMGAYGIWASYALNLGFMLPCAYLSWHLWRPRGRAEKLALSKALAPGLEARQPMAEAVSVAAPEGHADVDMENRQHSIVDGQLAHRKHQHAPIDRLSPGRPEGVVHLSGQPSTKELTFMEKLTQVFSRRESLVFFWVVTVMGFGIGMIEGYLFLLLKDLGATDMLLGISITITCLSEVPFFQVQVAWLHGRVAWPHGSEKSGSSSIRVLEGGLPLHGRGWILRKLGSADVLLDVCLGAYVLRLLLYAALPHFWSIWWVLPVELLHGLTFACGWGAGCEKSKALAPAGLEATQQGVFQALMGGLGTGLGYLLGGFIAERSGFQVTFAIGAGVVAAGWALSHIFLRLPALCASMSGVKYVAVATDIK